MKAAEYISHFLEAKGISHVFELSGGMITHIIDAIYERQKIKIVSMHHEQGAAFAADGYARVAKVPGVALATSGPGATNLITGIASCFFDSVPALFITGQVNVNEQKGDKKIRQLGFQETDIVSMVGPITKAAYAVKDAQRFPQILEEAYRLSVSGRPGPVLIDIPMNVQRSEVPDTTFSSQNESFKKIYENSKQIDEIIEILGRQKAPLIIAGRGVSNPGHRTMFRNFSEKLGIPVVSSLLAVDVLPYDHPLRVGMIGTYGNRWANKLIAESDCLLVIGSRLDIRQTGADVTSFSDAKTIIHVDVDENEINNRLDGCIPVNRDASSFMFSFLKVLGDRSLSNYQQWIKRIESIRSENSDIDELKDIVGINPNVFMHLLSQLSKSAGAIVADVGSHQMWAAQSYECCNEQYFLSSGGMGAMGFALPAAIGACFSLQKPVLCISGDGGIQLNIQEFQTIIRNRLPVKIVVINNNSLGMIRQFQDSYFNGQYPGTVWGYSAPDFCALAEAYGIKAGRITEIGQAKDELNRMWQSIDEPYLLEVMIDKHTNVYPKIAFGRPISEMEPFSKPIDLEGT